MTKPGPGPSLCVAVFEGTAFIKVIGRATLTTSPDLKRIVAELRQRSFSHFVLDLRECTTMDSTFLGAMAALVLRNGHPDPTGPCIELLNANQRVLELIESLGVLDMFKVRQESLPQTLMFEETDNLPTPSREEITRNCLEAHRVLMKVNPENVPKFKDVTAFMAEDLKRMTGGGDGAK